MAEITPPFFVFEGHDLSIFDSLDSIEGGLEGVDVEDSIFEAFDAIGRVVRLEATGAKRGKFIVDIGETHVKSVDPTATGAARLYNLLIQYLQAIGRTIPHEARLNDLVAECISLDKQSL